MVLGQVRRRTFDTREVPERGLDHVAVFYLKTFHQLVAHLVHERRILVANLRFRKREFPSVQGSMTLVAERHQVVTVICSAVLTLYDVVDL